MPAAQTKDKVMAKATKTVNVVKCSVCGTMHLAEGDDYLVIYGNIHIGLDTAIIDGNIDEKGKVADSTIYCRKPACLRNLFEAMLGAELPEVVTG